MEQQTNSNQKINNQMGIYPCQQYPAQVFQMTPYYTQIYLPIYPNSYPMIYPYHNQFNGNYHPSLPMHPPTVVQQAQYDTNRSVCSFESQQLFQNQIVQAENHQQSCSLKSVDTTQSDNIKKEFVYALSESKNLESNIENDSLNKVLNNQYFPNSKQEVDNQSNFDRAHFVNNLNSDEKSISQSSKNDDFKQTKFEDQSSPLIDKEIKMKGKKSKVETQSTEYQKKRKFYSLEEQEEASQEVNSEEFDSFLEQIEEEEYQIVSELQDINIQNCFRNMLKQLQKYTNTSLKYIYEYENQNVEKLNGKDLSNYKVLKIECPEQYNKKMFTQKFNKFIKSKKFNNSSIKQVVLNKLYRLLLDDFILYESDKWLCRIDSIYTDDLKKFIKFLKLCLQNTNFLEFLHKPIYQYYKNKKSQGRVSELKIQDAFKSLEARQKVEDKLD